MILGYSRMNYAFVCLVLALCAVETNGFRFMQFFQGLNRYRQQQGFMDEGMEYVRENPTFAYNNFISPYRQAKPATQKTQQPRKQNTVASNLLKNTLSGYTNNANGMKTLPIFQGSGLQGMKTLPIFQRLGLQGMKTLPMFQGAGQQGGFNSKEFLDEGFEHVRERGTPGQMQSLMSNPNLFLSSLFL